MLNSEHVNKSMCWFPKDDNSFEFIKFGFIFSAVQKKKFKVGFIECKPILVYLRIYFIWLVICFILFGLEDFTSCVLTYV